MPSILEPYVIAMSLSYFIAKHLTIISMFWVKPVHQLFVSLRVTALNVEMNQKTKLNVLGRSSRFHFVLIVKYLNLIADMVKYFELK